MVVGALETYPRPAARARQRRRPTLLVVTPLWWLRVQGRTEAVILRWASSEGRAGS